MKNSINTNWDGIRHTDALATVIASRKVRNVRAIHVTNASIRSATISGTFELVSDASDPFTTYAGKRRVEVRCLWYGRKPPSTWMRITLSEGCTIIENYSGPVVANIGRMA